MRKLILFVLLFLSLFYSLKTQPAGEDPINFQTKKFKYILENASKYHADSIDIKKVSEAAYQAMLQAMDKQSIYYNFQDNTKRKENAEGKITGVGIDFYSINDTLIITEIEDESPAKNKGILSGDRIIFIDGTKYIGKSREEGMTALRGDTGTKVTLIVKRQGGNGLLEFELNRKKLPIIGITDAFLLIKTKIAYIKLTRFSENSYEEMKKVISKLGNIEALIFDLRDNTGGYIKSVQEITGMFFADSLLLTKTTARDNNFAFAKNMRASGEFKNIPLIVLMNNNSASGSEMFAGAIQDYDRGIVVGEISYGKGSVQKTFEMVDSTAFRITVADYCTPLGRPIDNERKGKKQLLDESLKMSIGKESYDNIVKQMQKYNFGKKVEVYKTKSGRILLGGGAIFPDVPASADSTTELTKFLKAKGVFLEYAFNYKKINEKAIIDEYANDYDKFMLQFKLTDQMVKDFYSVAVSKNLWNNDMFTKDKPYILNYIKAMIAYTFWGTKAYNKILLNYDPVMAKSILSLPEAKKLIISKE